MFCNLQCFHSIPYAAELTLSTAVLLVIVVLLNSAIEDLYWRCLYLLEFPTQQLPHRIYLLVAIVRCMACVAVVCVWRDLRRWLPGAQRRCVWIGTNLDVVGTHEWKLANRCPSTYSSQLVCVHYVVCRQWISECSGGLSWWRFQRRHSTNTSSAIQTIQVASKRIIQWI